MRQISRKLRWLVVVLVLVFVAAIVPVNYYLIKPGIAENLNDIIHVQNSSLDKQGGFLLTAVTTQQATALTYLMGKVDPDVEVVPQEDMLPQGMSMDEYLKIMERSMNESQMTAEVVALRAAGYHPKVTGQVTVEEILPGSPAKGKLQKGDIIKAADSKQVLLSDELVKKIQNRKVGDQVSLQVKRGKTDFSTKIKTTATTDKPHTPVIKVMISTRDLKYQLPVKIEINTQEIKGPSAGLMFTLEILNQFKSGNLDHGYLIAGTGTIDINGNVGEIGGVKQKVIAAEQAGAKYFLSPVANVKDARKGAHKIKVVPVKNLNEALRFLNSIKTAA